MVAVTGKIDHPQLETRPWVMIGTTLQIVLRTEADHGHTAGSSAKELSGGTNVLGSPAEGGNASVTALVEFTGNGASNKGTWPNGLILASDGYIYGTTQRGGGRDYGTIFKMSPAGSTHHTCRVRR